VSRQDLFSVDVDAMIFNDVVLAVALTSLAVGTFRRLSS
jgi:hypothetical protein